MKSRITVEIDYAFTGKPYLRIMEDATSDDLRDKAITEFRRVFAHQSQWCLVDFGQVQIDGTIQWNIRPIPPNQLKDEVLAMQKLVNQQQS